MHRVNLVVSGRVQGVGFRWFVRRRAEALGLAGNVRNRPDGAVEVDAEGGRDALATLAEQVRRGPTGARIHDVVENWSEGPGRFRGFEIVAILTLLAGIG